MSLETKPLYQTLVPFPRTHSDSICSVLTRVAGKDASKQFWKYHNEGILKKFKPQLQIGSLDTKKQTAPPTPPATPPPEEKKAKAQDKVQPQAESGAVAPVPTKDAKEANESMDPYGAMIPYSDPSWYHGVRVYTKYTWNFRLTIDHSITRLITV